METLELKHLAGYLPYRLKGNLINPEYFESQINKELYRIETGRTEKSKRYEICVIVGDYEASINDFKPILRPLSDLTKEITVNGETFIPVNELRHIYGWEYIWSFVHNKQGYFNVYAVGYGSVSKLLEWHFDVYGLIEFGLAVDINTI